MQINFFYTHNLDGFSSLHLLPLKYLLLVQLDYGFILLLSRCRFYKCKRKLREESIFKTHNFRKFRMQHVI